MGQDDKVGQGEDPNLTSPTPTSGESIYERLQAEDVANERRVFWSEVGIAAAIAFLAIAYFILA
ncbi:MAG: hypothetical protein JOY64_21040 [Alphaproteobacteria bacterium]|nr:hypothetical protein [Alphaproteobacteria bacterium]MBV8410127.1 hypothetical protein [Alphaproteobacteria bacterium]